MPLYNRKFRARWTGTPCATCDFVRPFELPGTDFKEALKDELYEQLYCDEGVVGIREFVDMAKSICKHYCHNPRIADQVRVETTEVK